MEPERTKATIYALLADFGGSYASALGIKLDGLRPGEVYKWFLAAVLYGARISENLATRTWHEFERHGLLTPQRILDAGRDELVGILDCGGYTRYDYKTAAKLLEINRTLLANYDGNLNALHSAATDSTDLERRIMALGKGIGPTTTTIFLRELRGRWEKSLPPLSPLAVTAAINLGLIENGTPAQTALPRVLQLWRDAGMPDSSFSDFEATLVRLGLRQRRQIMPKSMPHD